MTVNLVYYFINCSNFIVLLFYTLRLCLDPMLLYFKLDCAIAMKSAMYRISILSFPKWLETVKMNLKKK